MEIDLVTVSTAVLKIGRVEEVLIVEVEIEDIDLDTVAIVITIESLSINRKR